MPRTVVRMVPGWEAKVAGAAAPFRQRVMREVTEDIRRNIVGGGHVDTGALLASVRNTGRSIRIGTDHWAIIEYGSRPHLITTEKKTLTDRRRFYGKTVHHPGTAEYRVVRRAVYRRRGYMAVV